MPLDNRAWLAWGVAASAPAILGRNPVVLLELLIVVATVRYLTAGSSDWAWALRLLAIFSVIGVAFNLLTVHSGNHVLATIPESVPIAGGDITLNALVYGLTSGLAIFTVVLTWLHVASNLSWTMLMRQVPARLTTIAVAGSVAWSFLPGLRRAVRDIRESQRSRGMRKGSVRDLPMLIVPVLAGGLERSLVTAEVLETRGFGGSFTPARSAWSPLVLMGGLVALLSGVYCLAAGLTIASAILLTIGVACIVIEIRRDSGTSGTTHLRDVAWTRNDTIVTLAAALALAIIIVRGVILTDALAYNPYPTLRAPDVDPVMAGALLLLLTPAALDLATLQ